MRERNKYLKTASKTGNGGKLCGRDSEFCFGCDRSCSVLRTDHGKGGRTAEPLSVLSSSPKHVSHRRLSCLLLCLSSTVLFPYIAVLFLRGPSSRGSSVYTKTPMYGSQTPMYGSQTPMHGSRTPMYGSQTPTHGDGKTAHWIIYLYLCEIFLTKATLFFWHMHVAGSNIVLSPTRIPDLILNALIWLLLRLPKQSSTPYLY